MTQEEREKNKEVIESLEKLQKDAENAIALIGCGERLVGIIAEAKRAARDLQTNLDELEARLLSRS